MKITKTEPTRLDYEEKQYMIDKCFKCAELNGRGFHKTVDIALCGEKEFLKPKLDYSCKVQRLKPFKMNKRGVYDVYNAPDGDNSPNLSLPSPAPLL